MLRLHKPTPRNTGAAVTFSINPEKGHLYVTFVKQAGWDAQKHNGTFAANVNNPDGQINIKVTELEVAAMIDVLENSNTWNTVHNVATLPYMTQINMGPRINQQTKEVEAGYTFSVTKKDRQDPDNKLWIGIALSNPEAILVREHLKYLLHQSFSIRDFIAANNFANKQSQNQEAPPMDEPANENGSENYIPVQ